VIQSLSTRPVLQWHLGTHEYLPMHRGFDTYFGAPMTQNECYSNIIAPGSTRKGGKFGPCPLFNGSGAVPWRQSTGIYPHDKHAVDMVNVDEAYDEDASNVVRRAHRLGKPFFYYFASHHTHAPQFAQCQSACDERGADCLSNCTSRRGLFGDSLGLLDRSVGRMHALLEELGISNNTLTIFSADNVRSQCILSPHLLYHPVSLSFWPVGWFYPLGHSWWNEWRSAVWERYVYNIQR
jgi:arylsulfatase A